MSYKYLHLLASACLLFCLSFGSLVASPPAEIVKKSQGNPVHLEGEWDFYPHTFLSESKELPQTILKLQVPGIWNSALGSGNGFGTYRLVLEPPEGTSPDTVYGIKLVDMATASRVYWNGKLLGSSGVVSKNPEESEPSYQFQFYPLPWKEGPNELLVEISNFHHDKGGMWEPPYVGEWNKLFKANEKDLASSLFLAGAVFIIALYHFGLFYFRRSDKGNLLFGFAALLLSLRTLFTGERFGFNELSPCISWNFCLRLEYLTFYLSPYLFFAFFREFYPKYYPRLMDRILLIPTLIFISFLLVLPTPIYTKLNGYFQIVFLSGVLLILQGVFRAVINRKESSLLFAIGIISVAIAAFIDLLNAYQVVYTIEAIPIGIFVFILVQSLTLSRRFSRAFSDVESLSKRLLVLDKLKDDFLANTSHELKTPLNGIIGIAESMFDGIGGKLNQEQRQNLGMIVSSGKRLSSLVDDILDFSKMKNRDLDLDLKAIDLHQICDLVLVISRPLYVTKNLTVRNHVPMDFPPILGDEARLQQILFNLIGNAIKFTEKGRIDVSAEIMERMLVLSIKDTGIGIPKQKFADIFKSFEQGDASTTRKFGGTGLGLAITKRLVELHGGTIWVESVEGEGSVFRFTLPLAREGEIPMEKPPVNKSDLWFGGESPEFEPIEETTEEYDGEKIKVLVVDDEPINRQVLKNHLTLIGCDVHEASNGGDAIRMVRDDGPFELMLLDIMMPGMSGYDVCTVLRESYSLYQLPILFLTAKNQITDIIASLEAGGNDYLAKPFDKRELISRAKNLITLKKAVEEQNKFIAFQNELGLARKLQSSILPEEAPNILGIKTEFYYEPMESVGGDFFDFHAISETELGVLIADVSGHGIPAALISAMLKIAFSTQVRLSREPAGLMTQINSTLLGKMKGAFVTASYIYINLETKEMIHARCGHPPLIINRKGESKPKLSLPQGKLIGWIPELDIQEDRLSLKAGDRIVLYTDGITEATNADKEMIGQENWESIVQRYSGYPIAESKRLLLERIKEFTGNRSPDDDVTLVILEIE
ncbi:response regulator [Leptospira bourretii]|uniref:histidine kinase n=1 Tax=Leptospira bourretii TaxID=2484962 RepID=A0A4R9IM76_9LEPT|nr:response regulator [Leptospira bourretii]TGK91116.1 response regulator [Leptospira bourretii]TGL30709.1 response regulator [Leptospira bourretii]